MSFGSSLEVEYSLFLVLCIRLIQAFSGTPSAWMKNPCEDGEVGSSVRNGIYRIPDGIRALSMSGAALFEEARDLSRSRMQIFFYASLGFLFLSFLIIYVPSLVAYESHVHRGYELFVTFPRSTVSSIASKFGEPTHPDAVCEVNSSSSSFFFLRQTFSMFSISLLTLYSLLFSSFERLPVFLFFRFTLCTSLLSC